ncbi:MAG TPA: FtsX-like permease family protein [Bacteroidales bacterium]|nr:FtsX-like permease family protein [Bacteroidales bacterium]HNR41009.1 FtsX-like permease family protein [Bacteroidales bacterium]HPM17611.1 FtsX-like permease family protein [Bacteroidales bacterium]HPV15770.1 FtsX-like permease family protein [Bacteroidales bacterium]HQG75873.1 FtsX-like permease family protein [Bacteroidales bacterium]
MKEEFRLAWRNLWRNRRRTVITAASVFFAVFFTVITRSLQLGSYDHMINNIIQSFTGHLQVQHIKYHDDPLIDNSFAYNDSLISAISAIEKVVSVTPHIESFTLASNGPQTKGVAVIGIDPAREKHFSDPEAKLVRYRITGEAVEGMRTGELPEKVLEKVEKNIGRSYSSAARIELELGLTDEEKNHCLSQILKYSEFKNGYLSPDDKGILLADKLAGFLRAGIGDSIILMGQGYHGVSATGIFPVRGIIKLPSPGLDSRLVIMTIPAAQQLFDADGKITSLVINLKDRSGRTITKARNKINALLPDTNTSARTWYELNEVLYQQMRGDSQSGKLMLLILYFIIFFGIFGTVLMMISERRREFGVLVAIGMRKGKLKRIVIIEMVMLGIIGLITGLLAGTPLITYFNHNPVIIKGDLGKMMEDWGYDAMMPTAPVGSYFYWQVVIVILMILLAAIYPLRKIGKLKETEALKS